MKKITSVFLAVVMLCLLVMPALAASSGTYSSWAEGYIHDADTHGILPDCLKNCDYQKDITRNEFCEMAYETMGYMAGYIYYYNALNASNTNGDSDFFDKYGFEAKPIYLTASEGNTPFTDTDNEKIIALNESGIILGKGDNKFAPDDILTREEAATILERIAAHFDLQTFSTVLSFSDSGKISVWATDGVKAVCGMGVMVGISNNIFSPDTTYTREQAVTTMIRLIESIPYMQNKEQIADGLYFRFNSIWLWVEDAESKVVFKLPKYWATYNYRIDYGYDATGFFAHDGKIIAAVFGKSAGESENHTSFFDINTNTQLLSFSGDAGYFYGLSVDKQYIIMSMPVLGTEPGDWGTTCYGVCDFTGKELLSTTHDWSELYQSGYVNTEYSVQYTWR